MVRSIQRQTYEFGETWTICGREAPFNDWGELVIFHDDLERCTATDLQAAFRQSCGPEGFCVDMAKIAVDDYEFYDRDSSATEPISFKLHNDASTISLLSAFSPEDDRNLPQVVRSTLEPLLRRHRMAIIDCELPESIPQLQFVDTLVGFSTRGRTLHELYNIGNDALALVGAIASREPTRTTLGDLIRAGHANVLIGQSEGHWLEVKCQHYDLHTEAGKIKLAQTVGRFCNAEDGGLVVIGMSTKRVPGGHSWRLSCPARQRDAASLSVRAREVSVSASRPSEHRGHRDRG
jgi:hypothetical protein